MYQLLIVLEKELRVEQSDDVSVLPLAGILLQFETDQHKPLLFYLFYLFYTVDLVYVYICPSFLEKFGLPLLYRIFPGYLYPFVFLTHYYATLLIPLAFILIEYLSQAFRANVYLLIARKGLPTLLSITAFVLQVDLEHFPGLFPFCWLLYCFTFGLVRARFVFIAFVNFLCVLLVLVE